MTRLILTCLAASLLLPAAALAQCEGISIQQDGLFVVIDHHADYNCAVFDLHHEVALEGDVLSVTETATADGWADCYCPYFSVVMVGGLAPGDYTLVYAYGEWVEGEEPPVFTWCELPFTVTGAPLPEDPIMVQTSVSGCGIATAVPGEPLAAPRSLSEVKALYH
jgi:hypothetical protein